MIRRFLAAALVVGAAIGTTACTSTVTGMQPAPDANNPACAEVMVRLPSTVDGQRRWPGHPSNGAWGSPAAVLMACGFEAPGPSTLPCETVGRVDWLVDDTAAPDYRFVTFGRTPAVEVYVDYDEASGRGALEALANAVDVLPTTGQVCTARTDG